MYFAPNKLFIGSNYACCRQHWKMEAVSRWLCSFVAEKVRIQRLYTTVTCGENVRLCSITLTNPRSRFKNYHENKSSVLYRNAEVPDCEIYIKEENFRQIDVYCYACRAIKGAIVRLDLGKWYLFEKQGICHVISETKARHFIASTKTNLIKSCMCNSCISSFPSRFIIAAFIICQIRCMWTFYTSFAMP